MGKKSCDERKDRITDRRPGEIEGRCCFRFAGLILWDTGRHETRTRLEKKNADILIYYGRKEEKVAVLA